MALQNEKNSRYLLRDWKPENPAFWENKGKHIARRNLWISVSCLLLAFCVWMLFSAVTVNLNKIGFNFTTDQLFLLTALPSVSGALLRVPYSFMVPIFGGRRWTVFSTAILIIPCVWLGIAVQNPNTPFGIFIVIALLCGFAGANFASSMGNISFFFPKAKQGSALGINGGLGNLGVSVMQLVAPLVIFVPVFAFLGVNGVPQADGSVMSLANAAWIWVQRSRHRNGSRSGLYLSHWRSGRLFYSAGVWHVAQYDRLSGGRDESVFNLLHRLCATDLAGLWSAEVQPKIRDRCLTRLIRLQPCRIRQGIRSQFIPGAGVMS